MIRKQVGAVAVSGQCYPGRDAGIGAPPGGLAGAAGESGLPFAPIQSAEEKQAEFLNVLIHDLKAPLRNVRQLSAMIRDCLEDGDTAGLEQFVSMQEIVAERAARLIGAIERYAILDRDPPRTSVDLGEVVGTAKAALASKTGRRVKVTIKHMPAVRGDAEMLGIMFEELIENAMIYTDRDVAEVTITGQDHGPDCVRISVSDNGLGIEPRYRDLVFEPMKRLWSADQYPGTGLGLAIVKRVVDLHGGKVRLQTAQAGGLDVTLSLPKA